MTTEKHKIIIFNSRLFYDFFFLQLFKLIKLFKYIAVVFLYFYLFVLMFVIAVLLWKNIKVHCGLKRDRDQYLINCEFI